MIYDIDDIILQCVDEETGEIDAEKLDALTIERDGKIENLALWYKDLIADASAVEVEAKKLKERADAEKRKAESLKSYLRLKLDGEKFKTSRCSISYRKSERVEISAGTDVNDFSERFKVTKIEVKPNKTAIKEYLKGGGTIDGCSLEETRNIQIK